MCYLYVESKPTGYKPVKLETCGQSYKDSTIINYDTRVMLTSKLLIVTPLEMWITIVGLYKIDHKILFHEKIFVNVAICGGNLWIFSNFYGNFWLQFGHK